MRRGHRITWASRLNAKNERIESAVDHSAEKFFSASTVLILPHGEVLSCDIFEHGKKIAIRGRKSMVVIPSRVLWDFVDALRKADGMILEVDKSK